ncbi:RIP homotypic interaction motif-containing protein [Micromonospora sp. HUAS LYJ1]|uniref:RIP homotypic interaction motif-containing protein n=1 Tax=Micromonospora sp. HUAS LYJ1 TaxID=3061626 RepID=UPI002673511B|nr:RIP homotypic interaction motif-containing protein [Micromonospora sp. HUAS LYJ1]WKU07701.1 RIP homotypic interaction motif-containing protein [Micromonospora sp. HUAS LYJ1]
MSLVVGALAAGLSDTISVAVKDAYSELRDALLRRLRKTGSPEADPEQIVEALEARVADPNILKSLVISVDVANDEDVLAAARQVLRASDPAQAKVGKYVIDMHDAKGVQIGDNSNMNIKF